MNENYFRQAALFAEKLEAEVQRLDALQRACVQQLIEDLTDVSFLSAQTSEATHTHLSLRNRDSSSSFIPVAAAELSVSARMNTTLSPSKCAAGEGSNSPTRLSRSPPRQSTARVSCGVAAAGNTSAFFGNETLHQTALLNGAEQRAGRSGDDAVAQKQSPLRSPPQLPPPPPPPRSRREEEARRARQALRCIREERDAHFNAKARRAQELLEEGREATQRSRARHLAEKAEATKRRGKKNK